jgi:hypothetical protein
MANKTVRVMNVGPTIKLVVFTGPDADGTPPAEPIVMQGKGAVTEIPSKLWSAWLTQHAQSDIVRRRLLFPV